MAVCLWFCPHTSGLAGLTRTPNDQEFVCGTYSNVYLLQRQPFPRSCRPRFTPSVLTQSALYARRCIVLNFDRQRRVDPILPGRASHNLCKVLVTDFRADRQPAAPVLLEGVVCLHPSGLAGAKLGLRRAEREESSGQLRFLRTYYVFFFEFL